MADRSRRGRWTILGLGSLVLIMVAWLLFSDTSHSLRGSHQPQSAAGADPALTNVIPSLRGSDEPPRTGRKSPPQVRPLVTETVRVEVRDLGSNDLLPGVELTLLDEVGAKRASVRAVTSDALGRILIPLRGPERIVPAQQQWLTPRAGGTPYATVLESKTIFLVRSARIHVEVLVDGMQEEESPDVQLLLVRPPDLDSPATNPHGYAHDEQWMSRMGLARKLLARIRRKPTPGSTDIRLTPDGRARLEVRVPVLKGFMLLARARNWRAGSSRLLGNPIEDMTVSLRLTRSHMIQGTLLDGEDRPLPGVDVHLHALVRRDDRVFPYRAVQDQDLGFGWLVKNGSGKGGLSVELTCRTDGRGRFQIGFPLDGYSARLVARPKGHRPARLLLGTIHEAMADLRLVANRPDATASVVKLLYSGKPLANVSLWLLDITDEFRQEKSRVKTAADGTLDTKTLEVGHIYSIVVRQKSPPLRTHGCFIWSKQSELRVDELEKNPDTLR